MANRTVKDARTIKGTNPQYIIEKITRTRVYESKFWKEECFALTAELLVDKAMELKYIGGTYGGNIKPTPFLCLVLKMLQIQPEKDIIIEFIRNEDYKYVRCLGAFYLRLTGTALDCYNYLEPLYNDYRKIKVKNRSGVFELSHVDEYVEQLVNEETWCGQILPRIQKRQVLEETNLIESRVSALDDDLVEESSDDELPDYVYNMEPRAKLNFRRSPRKSPVLRRSPRRRSRSPAKRRHSRSPKRKRSVSPKREDRRVDRHSPRRERSPVRRERSRSPARRSPARRERSPPRRERSPARRERSPPRRERSPPRRERSPPRRERSPRRDRDRRH